MSLGWHMGSAQSPRTTTMLLPAKLANLRFFRAALLITSIPLILWSLLHFFPWHDADSTIEQFLPWDKTDLPVTSKELPLPPDYSSWEKPRPMECAKRYSTLFLQNIYNTSVNYCAEDSASALTCVRSSHSGKQTDSFCIGSPASFNPSTAKFGLGCELRKFTEDEEKAGVPRLENFPTYWYETGTRLVLDRHVDFGVSLPKVAKDPTKFSILVRREAPIDNLWHHFMQIFAVFLTLDVFQMTRNPGTGLPLFQSSDIDNTQVVIFDRHDDGPFFDQWQAFAKRGVVRAKDLATNSTEGLENIIVALPGVSNPLWSGDWAPDICEGSELMQVFRLRMLRFYGIKEEEEKAPDRPLVLTFIDRTEKRSLVDKERYVNDLKPLYPNITINLVNFAKLSFKEQIITALNTDILAGVHGAGLSHAIFLPERSALVEIMPHGFYHKGFRNLAKRIGHKYFTTHAVQHEKYTTSKGWQYDDVFIEQDRFTGLIDAAVKSMYHRGSRDDDIN